ncbi:hypothetical protein NESM_000105900 [Novymonas esmeraldas]|uniref:Uncharacterized protein n=1 Tax=Novymonas esmeraldas TaxID=1808958 RepID=A0AAW0F1U0_9TRYP
MDDACSFQPQINPRSRRLARHAPTLRERQEQEEEQRRRSVAGADDVDELVWELWRSVASGEARDAETVYVRRECRVAEGAGPPPPLPQRPRVVHVTTVLGMLAALGITPPAHSGVIAKFLAAMAVDGGAASACARDATVEATRFLHVFATVWRAAVTTRAGWTPSPAHSGISPRRSPQRRRSLTATTMRRLRPPPPLPPSSTAPSPPPASGGESARTSAASCSPGVGVDETTSGATSAPRSQRSSSRSPSASPATDAAESDADFLHRNMSSASSSTAGAPSVGDACGDDWSPLGSGSAAAAAAGLSPSPDPRDPSIHVATPAGASAAPHSRQQQQRRRLLPATPSLSPRRCSSVRVLPSGSHLLASTASRDLKKATKRVPGGLMRECTFKPAINAAAPGARAAEPAVQPPSAKPASVEAAVRRMIAARQHRHEGSAPQPGPSTQASSAVRLKAAGAAAAPPPLSRKPLLYVDVDLPRGRHDRLALHAGDDVDNVAMRFSILHGLSDDLRLRLATALADQLRVLESRATSA